MSCRRLPYLKNSGEGGKQREADRKKSLISSVRTAAAAQRLERNGGGRWRLGELFTRTGYHGRGRSRCGRDARQHTVRRVGASRASAPAGPGEGPGRGWGRARRRWRLGMCASGRLSSWAARRTAREPSGDAQRPQERPSVGRRRLMTALKLQPPPRAGISGVGTRISDRFSFLLFVGTQCCSAIDRFAWPCRGCGSSSALR